MKNRIIIGIVSIIVGLEVSFLLESLLRDIIIDLYQLTTHGNIQFVGKNFYFFTTPFFHISVGLSFMIFSLEAFGNKAYNNLKNAVVWIIVFFIAIIGICALDANLKVIQCTLCDNGILKLGYGELNYSFILGLSTLLSGLPSIIRLIRHKYEPAYNNT